MSYASMHALVTLNKEKWHKENVQTAQLLIKLGYKMITYTAVGIVITWFAPSVFRLLNIERPSFHTEI